MSVYPDGTRRTSLRLLMSSGSVKVEQVPDAIPSTIGLAVGGSGHDVKREEEDSLAGSNAVLNESLAGRTNEGSTDATQQQTAAAAPGRLPTPIRLKIKLRTRSPSIEMANSLEGSPAALPVVDAAVDLHSPTSPLVGGPDRSANDQQPTAAVLASKRSGEPLNLPRPPAKRSKAPKRATWKDIPSTPACKGDLFGLFPAEVLDLIISVDSDLDLRDHLALAGTCRFFRRCYTDVVFQVLFDASRVTGQGPIAHGPLLSAVNYRVDNDPTYSKRPSSSSQFLYSHKEQPFLLEAYPDPTPCPSLGPHARSWNVGRHIFSSAGASGHGYLWDGWGLTVEEHERGAGERAASKAALLAALRAAKARLSPATPWADLPVVCDTARVFEVDMDEEERAKRLKVMPDWQRPLTVASWSRAQNTYDPWRSRWRKLVRDAVNVPLITKTQAKAVYRISDNELLTIPEFHHGPSIIRYRLAAVQALAYRSHGGPLGHLAHIARLKAVADKRLANKIKNGSIRPPMPKETMGALAAHDWEDWTADGMV